MQRLQESRKRIVRTLTAKVLDATGRAFHSLAVKLEDRVESRDTFRSREMRKKLRSACRQGTAIEEEELAGALLSFGDKRKRIAHEENQPIDWHDVDGWERWKAERALWKAARSAHPIVALRALYELDAFIAPALMEALTKARMSGTVEKVPEQIATLGRDALPYIATWIEGNHYRNGTHPAVLAVGLIRDARALPYLSVLQRLPEEHRSLAQAAAGAAGEIMRQEAERAVALLDMQWRVS